VTVTDDQSHLTTSEVADLCNAPVWAVRRAVDALGLPIPRAGLYRLVPRELVERIRLYLAERQEARRGQ
jgi:hypothetical protein